MLRWEKKIQLICCCRCQAGDRIGCGVKFEAVAKGLQASMVPVFFTRNGKEVPKTLEENPLHKISPR